MIRFLLNDQWQTLEQCDPELTILEWLRTDMMLRGTKEGCASGDCGACTVVVAEPDGERSRLRYRTLNSCITLVGSLHGKQLLTVEHLQHNGRLHPVQRALVDHHGSQCGFCTPGFVMSLFALAKHNPAPSRGEVETALAGNLCRCTGYRPIVDAALSVGDQAMADQFAAREQQVCEQLLALRQEAPTGSLEAVSSSLKAAGRRLLAPASSDALAELLQAWPDARLVAGGTDLALEVTQQLKQPRTLIYTGKVTELQRLEVAQGRLLVGGAVNLSDLELVLREHLPEFAALLTRFGSRQIRNQATLAGNLASASPIGDASPVLLALDAQVQVRCGAEHQVIPIDAFFLGYRQSALPAQGFIEAIEIPLNADCYRRVYKVSKRFDDDISAVCAAFCLKLEQGRVVAARLAFGGMAATPARALQAEQALLGRPFTEAGIRDAQQALGLDFSPIDDVRASAGYRLEVARNLLLRALLEQSSDRQALEVVHYA